MSIPEKVAWLRRSYKLKRYAPLNPRRGRPWPRPYETSQQEPLSPQNRPTDASPSVRTRHSLGWGSVGVDSPEDSPNVSLELSAEQHVLSPLLMMRSCPDFAPGVWISSKSHADSSGDTATTLEDTNTTVEDSKTALASAASILEDAEVRAKSRAKVHYAIHLLSGGRFRVSPELTSRTPVQKCKGPIPLSDYSSFRVCDAVGGGAEQPKHDVSVALEDHKSAANLELQVNEDYSNSRQQSSCGEFDFSDQSKRTDSRYVPEPRARLPGGFNVSHGTPSKAHDCDGGIHGRSMSDSRCSGWRNEGSTLMKCKLRLFTILLGKQQARYSIDIQT